MSGIGSILIAAAAPRECEAIAAGLGGASPAADGRITCVADSVWLLRTGVGPIAAGVSAGWVITPGRFSAVVNLGIAGLYDAANGSLLDRLLATASIPADQGLLGPSGFVPVGTMGFPMSPQDGWNKADAELSQQLAPLAAIRGPVATVSSVTGTDDRAAEIAARSKAVAEAMEGASVALACHRAGTPFAEFRVISNLVGDRAVKPWKLDEAIACLGGCASDICRVLSGAESN